MALRKPEQHLAAAAARAEGLRRDAFTVQLQLERAQEHVVEIVGREDVTVDDVEAAEAAVAKIEQRLAQYERVIAAAEDRVREARDLVEAAEHAAECRQLEADGRATAKLSEKVGATLAELAADVKQLVDRRADLQRRSRELDHGYGDEPAWLDAAELKVLAEAIAAGPMQGNAAAAAAAARRQMERDNALVFDAVRETRRTAGSPERVEAILGRLLPGRPDLRDRARAIVNEEIAANRRQLDHGGHVVRERSVA